MPAYLAFREASRNAMHVVWAGLVFFCLYFAVISFGPGLEGKFLPVITDYKMVNVRHLQNGAISFDSEFVKERDCTYYGVNWFAPDERGNLTRVQIRRSDSAPTAPQTGPVGERIGNRQYIVPPPGTRAIFGIMHHDCGRPWQTRTQIGPFSMEDGRLITIRELVDS